MSMGGICERNVMFRFKPGVCIFQSVTQPYSAKGNPSSRNGSRTYEHNISFTNKQCVKRKLFCVKTNRLTVSVEFLRN